MDVAGRIHQVEEILKYIRYKPGWDFSVNFNVVEQQIYIHICTDKVLRNEYHFHDTRLHGHVIGSMYTPVCGSAVLGDMLFGDESLIIGAIFDQIKYLELHEAQENFYYNKKRIYDPHI